MREKGFAPILIILLATALIVGYLIYSGKININKSQPINIPTTQSSPSATINDETANWKVYTNKDYSFSFKYPAQFTLKEDIKNQQNSEVLYTFWFYTKDQKYSGYNVKIHKAPGKTILQEFPQEFRQQAPSIPVETLSNKQGADEAASAEKTDDGYQSGTRYFRVEGNFFVISPIYQDSNSDDKIWNYPVLDTLVFNQESKSTPISEELHGFPVFPGAEFVEKKMTPSCKELYEGHYLAFSMCGSTTYTWTSDQADKVYDWYKNDPEHTGWKMGGSSGEFTDEQNYGINSGFLIGAKFYGFNLNAENNKVSFSLGIPYEKFDQ